MDMYLVLFFKMQLRIIYTYILVYLTVIKLSYKENIIIYVILSMQIGDLKNPKMFN